MQIILLHIAISFAVAIQYMKDQEASTKSPGCLWEALKFVLFPLCHFVQHMLPRVQNSFRASQFTQQTKQTSQIEPEMKGKNFPPFGHWRGAVKNPTVLQLYSTALEISLTLLDNPSVKSLFIIFMPFWDSP